MLTKKVVVYLNKELMKGSIDILLLSQIVQKDMYGFEIIKNLKVKSNNLYVMSEGTLYPALQRLELKKLVKSYWGDSEAGGRRKYYNITDYGKKELEKKIEDWESINDLIISSREDLEWIDSKATLAQY